jgi:hypothetical protein
MHGISFRRLQRIACIHSPKRPTLRPTRYTYEEVSAADQGLESGGPDKVPIPKRPPSAARIAITDITLWDDLFDSMLVCRVGDWMSTSAERYSSTPTKAELGIAGARGLKQRKSDRVWQSTLYASKSNRITVSSPSPLDQDTEMQILYCRESMRRIQH